jgi:hypothetical protein
MAQATGEVFPWTPKASLLSSGNHHVDSKSKSEDLQVTAIISIIQYLLTQECELRDERYYGVV